MQMSHAFYQSSSHLFSPGVILRVIGIDRYIHLLAFQECLLNQNIGKKVVHLINLTFTQNINWSISCIISFFKSQESCFTFISHSYMVSSPTFLIHGMPAFFFVLRLSEEDGKWKKWNEWILLPQKILSLGPIFKYVFFSLSAYLGNIFECHSRSMNSQLFS